MAPTDRMDGGRATRGELVQTLRRITPEIRRCEKLARYDFKLTRSDRGPRVRGERFRGGRLPAARTVRSTEPGWAEVIPFPKTTVRWFLPTTASFSWMSLRRVAGYRVGCRKDADVTRSILSRLFLSRLFETRPAERRDRMKFVGWQRSGCDRSLRCVTREDEVGILGLVVAGEAAFH